MRALFFFLKNCKIFFNLFCISSRSYTTNSDSDLSNPFKGLVSPLVKYSGLDSTENLRSLVQAEQNKSGIYCIVNRINGKIYVGSAVNISRRINEHFLKAPKLVIQYSIAKYGPSAFDVYVLEYVSASREAL